MSWLGSLRSDFVGGSGSDSGGVEDFSVVSSEATERSSDDWEGEEEELIEQGLPRRRVKEDLSEFTKALSSKFWGVASFLAPSPSSQTPSSPSSTTIYFSAESSPPLGRHQQEPTISGESDLFEASNESSRTAGIRSDFAEIGGTLKTGIARLSNNVAINGISKIASAILPLREEGEDEELETEEREEYEDEHVSDVIGVTDEVLAFARNIACHPETWLDFPLLSDDEYFDDFDMSVAQKDHALVVESLAPRLAALRIELCPTHMSLGYFWKIYFALLHPRLNKHDADLLSTPQIVEARAMLQHGLQIHAKQESEDFWRHPSFKNADDALNSTEQFSTPRMPTSPTKPWFSNRATTSSLINDFEMEKQHSIINSEAEFVDKFVVNEESYLQTKVKEMVFANLDDEDDDEWPEDETHDENHTILLCNEEDISFSDLEDDDCSSFSKTI